MKSRKDKEFKAEISAIYNQIKGKAFKKLSKYSQNQLKKKLQRLTDKYINE